MGKAGGEGDVQFTVARGRLRIRPENGRDTGVMRQKANSKRMGCKVWKQGEPGV